MGGRLRERFIQRKAIEWLEAHYKGQKDKFDHAISLSEARIRRSKLGHGRADGLIVARRLDGTLLTIALEAKSSKTHHQVKERLGCGALFMSVMSLASVASFAAAWVSSRHFGWVLTCVFALCLFVLSAVVSLWLLEHLGVFKSVSVVEQISRYPAGEKWIALGADHLARLGDDMGLLGEQCEARGIGILRVRKEGIEVVLDPEPGSRSDFLTCYHDEDKARLMLLAPDSDVPVLKG